MSTAAVFSVVVPCYGHARFVAHAIDSLWAQTVDAFEIIAVDDGSPDDTGEILDHLAARSPVRMRVIHTANLGAHAALNAGAAVADAPYLAFLNDDDAYEPDRLDVFVRVIGKSDGFGWGFCGIEPMDENGHSMRLADIADAARRVAISRSRTPLEALRALPRANSVVTSGNLVVAAQFFRDVGGFRDFRFTHDWDLALRLLESGPPFIVQRPLYRYRVHAQNAFGRGLSGEGAQLAARESELVFRQEQERLAATRFSFVSLDVARWVSFSSLDPDGEWAVRITLWGLAKLRGIRPLYGALRNAVRFARDVRRRWVTRGG